MLLWRVCCVDTSSAAHGCTLQEKKEKKHKHDVEEQAAVKQEVAVKKDKKDKKKDKKDKRKDKE